MTDLTQTNLNTATGAPVVVLPKVMRLRQKRAALRHSATKGLKKAGDKGEKKVQ